MKYMLGFLGAGNMAEAIARAAIERGVIDAHRLIAADPSEDRRALFAALGIEVTDNNAKVIGESEQVLLAVKPQMLDAIAADLAAHLRPDQVLLSIMAGVTTSRLSQAIAAERSDGASFGRIVRVMPNTPMMVGFGMAGVARSPGAQRGDDALAMKLFAAGGEAVAVDEAQLDAITAVSGSGPAYVFYLAEAMEKAARELGLDEHARLLVTQTVLGAAHLLRGSPDTAAELRRKVTSPGGTTEAAIRHLDGNKTSDVIVNAIKAAEQRSRELGG